MRKVPWRGRLEVALAVASAALGILTLVWRDWVEAIAGVDPDHHNGSLEWVIAFGLLAAAVAVGALARRDLRRTTTRAKIAPVSGEAER